MATVQALDVREVVASVRGHTITGRFVPATRELRVLTRPWAGQVFDSPADAARALDSYFGARRATTQWRLVDGGVLRASARRV